MKNKAYINLFIAYFNSGISKVFNAINNNNYGFARSLISDLEYTWIDFK